MTDDSNRDFSGAVNQSPGMNEREGLAARLEARFGRDRDGKVNTSLGMKIDAYLCEEVFQVVAALRAPAPSAWQPIYEGIRWQRVNEEPFEYAIQQGPIGDEFVKLMNGTCLRRALPSSDRGGVG